MKHTPLFLVLLSLTACDRMDYQWVEPKAYNETLYPKKLQTATDRRSDTFTFDALGGFDDENRQALHAFFNKLSSSAAESIVLTFSDDDENKHLYVVRMLRSMGYPKRIMKLVVDRLAPENSVRIDLQTALVVLPDCPDWRKSGNTNYSNTLHSNMHCSIITNTGRMLVNPRDVDHSSNNHVVAEPAVDAMAIGTYRGEAAAAAAAGTATSISEAGADSTSKTTGQ